ncbi:FkbM family methyltransferase [Faunimonas sp. B44]|uniref:FkbM family methyltransferase n=1 Tax=Faunimonas sp. B44 TaxID=3461493 RepID=UPI004043E8D6
MAAGFDAMAFAGLLRSLALYYGVPGRNRRLRAFYAGLVRPGDLVFDIGAHVGNRTRALHAVGATVIAVEPQPLLAGCLRRTLPGNRIVLVEHAVGGCEGEATLLISRRHPTVSTADPAFPDAVGTTAGFEKVRWDRSVTVPMTTLDRLVATYGRPAFVKIDVEGLEADILGALSAPVPLLAFEYLPAAPEVTAACLDRLGSLGAYRLNAVVGEDHRFVWPDWVDPAEAAARMPALCRSGRSGDLYARLVQ